MPQLVQIETWFFGIIHCVLFKRELPEIDNLGEKNLVVTGEKALSVSVNGCDGTRPLCSWSLSPSQISSFRSTTSRLLRTGIEGIMTVEKKVQCYGKKPYVLVFLHL